MPTSLDEGQFREALFTLVRLMVERSDGRMRLALNEEDDSNSKNEEAAHFLKIDEKRVGRDIELYGFLSKIQGQQVCLTMVFEEIVLQVKAANIIGAYRAATEQLEQLGQSVFEGEILNDWRALLV